ncbi:MAG: EamA family transporter [Candidatus Latescibacteria bacterium]|nr:EamA family transporter [Candidatus Latescibacterota bacterium]NIM22500.1 EamA family transporter [Candidatus Latescibacterota bacterium]NIM64814.1 EamA family transporter [Candidatus Latescibacterota bacterium]NIO01322.1 EamA family transporter [Candidatus Latescibacterota bacterium]NIO27811.1 EamA family transporter [Candidatus Latescibacterota bacterium]
MSWLLLAILGAFFDASYYAFIKRFLEDVDRFILASGTFLNASLFLFLLAYLNGIPATGPAFYDSVLITGSLNVLAALLYFEALKQTDLSLSIPMISFTPVFLILTSFLVLREIPSPSGAVGIVLIVLGSYVLHTGKDKGTFFDPFKNIFRNKGVLYMLLVAFLYSITANFDKRVVQNSDPIFGSSMIFLFIGVSFLVISMVKAPRSRMKSWKNIYKFLPPGAAISMAAVTINFAFTMQIVPYVISIKRLSIVFSVLLGGVMFRERDISRRSIGALIMLAGAALIALF